MILTLSMTKLITNFRKQSVNELNLLHQCLSHVTQVSSGKRYLAFQSVQVVKRYNSDRVFKKIGNIKNKILNKRCRKTQTSPKHTHTNIDPPPKKQTNHFIRMACHRCNIRPFPFDLYKYSFLLYNFPFIVLYKYSFILYDFLFVFYDF